MIPPPLAEGLELIGIARDLAEDDELALTSLQVVTLVEHLERELGILLDAKDVTRQNFASKASLGRMLAQKGVTR